MQRAGGLGGRFAARQQPCGRWLLCLAAASLRGRWLRGRATAAFGSVLRGWVDGSTLRACASQASALQAMTSQLDASRNDASQLDALWPFSRLGASRSASQPDALWLKFPVLHRRLPFFACKTGEISQTGMQSRKFQPRQMQKRKNQPKRKPAERWAFESFP